jgi:hypothetical protein
MTADTLGMSPHRLSEVSFFRGKRTNKLHCYQLTKAYTAETLLSAIRTILNQV